MKNLATYIVTFWMLLLTPTSSMWSQVNICYDFEDCSGNSRPMGWGALPNLDYHYVGIDAYDNTAHTGSKALKNNGTTCFTVMPDEGINYGADSVWLTFWYWLHLNTDWVEVGYLTDATDSSTFHVLDTLHGWQQVWHFFALDLSSVPTGARIAFFGHDIFSGDGTFWLDDVYLTDAPCWLWNLHVAEITADSVRLEWHKAGSPGFSVGWGNHTYYPSGTSITLPRIPYFSSVFPYEITYCSLPSYYQCPCRTGAQGVYSHLHVLPYRQASCINVEDGFSTAAIPYTGTPVEPYLSSSTRTTTDPGITGIYAGSHTLNTNPGPDGGGMMVFPRTIPPGDVSTMRLGNRLGDWESASMLYTITVDTNMADLLVMKYTVAMAFGTFQGTEEAHRNDTLHPAWFRINMMDTNHSPLIDGCSQFYIDAWDTAGWDEMNNQYKRRNFTGMAFDLRPWHGQRLQLRVTACDGAVNNRWCYAYYNFTCLKHHDIVHDCYGDSVTLEAPYGFIYRWWCEGDTATIGTTQSITQPADGTLYRCQLRNRFELDCVDTITRYALAGTLITECDTVLENELPQTFRGITFNTAVDTLFTIPSEVGCDTVVHYVLQVWTNHDTLLTLRLCPNAWPTDWQGHHFDGPDSVTFHLTDIHGADSTVTLIAEDAPTYEVSDTVLFCPGASFIYNDVDYGGPTIFDTLLTTVDGCDSLVHVALLRKDSTFRIAAFYSIDGIQWTDTVPITLCANQILFVVDSSHETQSTQWIVDRQTIDTSHETQMLFEGGDNVRTVEVLFVASSHSGCQDTLRWPVTVFPPPKAEFEWSPENPLDMTPEVLLRNLTQPTNCGWLWTVETARDNADSLSAFSPLYRWPKGTPTGDYDVTLLARLTLSYDSLTHTCVDTSTHTITIVTALLSFPNVVTPNGDGINDRWEIVNLIEMGIYPVNELWIYNRWGQQVFHAINIRRHDEFWDPNNPSCPDGTYFFQFQAFGEYGRVSRNGCIEVLR